MDLTEGLILSSMMGNGGGSGGGGNPGYHVEIENIGTLIPQQTVTTEEHEGVYGALVTVTIPEGMDAPPEQVQVVFDGVTYLCPYDDESGSFGAPIDQDTGLITDWSEYPFIILFGGDGNVGKIATETPGTYTVSADAVGTQLVIDPEFEEAVNTVVGDSGGSSQSELPDYSGKGRYTLVTDARGEHISWNDLAYTESGSSGMYTKQTNYYTKNAVIHVHGTILAIKQNITAGWFSGMKQYTTATLALYSTNGLELVYEINPTPNSPTLIYDKGTESPANVTVQGDVVIVTNS